MNKVQKIREEVVRMHSLLPVMDGDNISVNYADRICTTLEMYIDFLQKEPKAKFKVGDSVLYLNEEYVIIDNKKHYTLRSTKERTSVPVVHIDFGNEDYELCLVEKSKKCMYSKDHYTNEDRKALCDGCEEECKYIKSDDFTKALAECIMQAQGSVVDPMVHAEIWKDELIKLAKSEEPVSEDLGDYINELSKQFPEVSFAKLSRIAVRVANWQKEQIKRAMDLGEPPYLISVEQAYYKTLKLLEE